MDSKRNFKLILEYDGTQYHGWQRQKNDTTIQAILEDKLRLMLKERIKVNGSGRTDAGVHALYQVCNFVSGSRIDPESLRRGLNSLLPDDIFIKEAENISLDFHARYSAKSKVYEYRILNTREKNIFLRNYTWHIRYDLDLHSMSKCVSMLMGRHDFSAFRSTGSGNRDPVRNMIKCEVYDPGENLIRFVFEADGFLRHMVRNIVGTVVEAGSGKISVEDFREIYLSGDRQRAGIKAPPQGLFLKKVDY
jgi:tRNA pseudouridine38-40 synthase